MKIAIAEYRHNGLVREIHATSLSRAQYLKKFRGFLYCTEKNCNALLSFVERKKQNTKYFRTWSKSKHKENCPNEVSYDEDRENRTGAKNEEKINISDSHLVESLNRAYERIFSDYTKPPVEKQRKVRSKNKDTEIESTSGEATLFDEGAENKAGREPYIQIRNFDKLDESDINHTRCVTGRVKSICLFEKHGYINFITRKANRVKVYFSEYFINRNEAQYRNFSLIQSYYESQKEIGDVICCCIGKVRKGKNGINVNPDRSIGFTLNGLNYYDILRQVHKID